MRKLIRVVVILVVALAGPARARAQSIAKVYVSGSGADTNPGTESLPLASVNAAYDLLAPGGGVIVAQQGAKLLRATDPVGCGGLWIIGPYDPNYKTPPPCWRQQMHGPFSLVGDPGAGGGGSFQFGYQVNLSGSIWLANTNGGMTFKNLSIAACTPFRQGIDSTGSRNGLGSWNVKLVNVSLTSTQSAGCGPGWDIGGQSSNVVARDLNIVGSSAEYVALATLNRSGNVVTATATKTLPSSYTSGMVGGIVGASDSSFNGGRLTITVTGPKTFTYAQNGPAASATGGYVSSDRAQAVVVNPGNSQGIGLTLDNLMSYYGGIKVYPGSGQSSIFVRGVLEEAAVAPAVWVTGCNVLEAEAKDIELADQQTTLPAVRSDCAANFAGALQVENVLPGVEGPMTLLGGTGSYLIKSPLLLHQQGFGVLARSDAARRNFGPVATRFPNLVHQTGPWPNTNNQAAFTYGVLAPDGTFNATRITTVNPGQNGLFFSQANTAVAAGDSYAGGVWIRNPSGCGFWSSASMPVGLAFVSGAVTTSWNISGAGPQENCGEWNWIWAAMRVSSASSSPLQLDFNAQYSSTNPIEVYAPVLIHVPAGTLSDNEVAEYALAMSSYRDDAVQGQVSLLRGEQFKADSAQFGTVNAPPACTSATRGTYWDVWGATGAADAVEVCVKTASNTYTWTRLDNLMTGQRRRLWKR